MALMGEKPITHIRSDVLLSTIFCGEEGESISFYHYVNAHDHVVGLKMCQGCEHIANHRIRTGQYKAKK